MFKKVTASLALSLTNVLAHAAEFECITHVPHGRNVTVGTSFEPSGPYFPPDNAWAVETHKWTVPLATGKKVVQIRDGTYFSEGNLQQRDYPFTLTIHESRRNENQEITAIEASGVFYDAMTAERFTLPRQWLQCR